MKGDEKEGWIDLAAWEAELHKQEKSLSNDPDQLQREYHEITAQIEATEVKLKPLELRRQELYKRFPRVDRHRELTFIQATQGLAPEDDHERGRIWQTMEPSERTANERIEALAEPIRNLAAALDLLRRYQSALWLRLDLPPEITVGPKTVPDSERTKATVRENVFKKVGSIYTLRFNGGRET